MIMSIKMNNMDDDDEGCYNTNKAHSSSFSATLLEAIYRSIDEEEQLMFRAVDFSSASSSSSVRSHTKNNNNKKPGGGGGGARSSSSSKREEIEKWMEKRTASTGFHDHYHYPRTAPPGEVNKKISSCSAKVMSSTSGGGHRGCSQLDKHYQTLNVTIPKSKSTNSGYQMGNPANHKALLHGDGGGAGRSGSSHFVKTKSHALRFYRELKKMRQPISPGGRLAALINSLFLTGHSKKDKFPTEGNEHHMEAASAQTANGNNVNNKSTCSSASSFSRSCLSHKTSSSSSASSAHKAARSVRFSSPDNTILVKERKSVRIMDGSCDDIQALLSKYQNEDLFAIYDKFASEGDDDDDEIISSCGSSDLFELDHLIGPGGMEELPVYETTRLDANRPIANSCLFV